MPTNCPKLLWKSICQQIVPNYSGKAFANKLSQITLEKHLPTNCPKLLWKSICQQIVPNYSGKAFANKLSQITLEKHLPTNCPKLLLKSICQQNCPKLLWKSISLVRLQNLVCAPFYQTLFLTWRQLRQFSAPGHKTLYAIANEKLLFCEVPKSRTSISHNYQF